MSAENIPTSPVPEQSGPGPAASQEELHTIEPGDVATEVTTYPLHPVDPAKIGDFWPSARLLATQSGVAYLASEDGATAPVMLILLSQGAAEDAAARDRFAGDVDRMDIDTVIARGGLDQDSGRMGEKFRSEEDDPPGVDVDGPVQAPWVALAFDQTPRGVAEAKRVLDDVDLSLLGEQGNPAGPDYQMHWADRFAPGLTRVWPLPWPRKRQRGGRLSILASWLLMLLIVALAVLIAILIFSQAPQTQPPPPIPSTASQSASGSSSESPSDSSSPSDSQSGSPSPSESSSGQTPSESQSVGGTPTPPSKL